MSLQLGPGPVRGPRADCCYRCSLNRPTEVVRLVCMLAFGTLFSCQGAQSSHSDVPRVGDRIATPVQSESRPTRKQAPSQLLVGGRRGVLQPGIE